MSKMKYRISSRATILLGRESVSKVDGAIIELVKNTYDADASLCYICFDIENDTIYLLDNGSGMTKEIIENYWMMIGTDNKREHYYSSKKRIKSGEKGIGRFALDRLGGKCKMYTKSSVEDLILWQNDWSNFEVSGKTIDEVEADFDYLSSEFIDIIPTEIKNNIYELQKVKKGAEYKLDTGTLFVINGLRDDWREQDKSKIFEVLSFLIPPNDETGYTICLQKSLDSNYIEISNEIYDEYDYKINAEFDGETFKVIIDRNEFDLNIMPPELFSSESFAAYPFRHEDFEKQKIERLFSISELTKNTNEGFIDCVKKIGPFKFDYSFIKLGLGSGENVYFYKQLSPNRRIWLEQYGGIKIFRDNFIVRPYGDRSSNSFDWLGLDARKGKNPVAISHKSGQWHVNNSQGQGTVFISRVYNNSILDKSSREGIIENEYFNAFSEIIKNIIGVFEQDRAYIARGIKLYLDEKNQKQNTKNEAKEIAKKILEKISIEENKQESENEKTLAQAVQYFAEEREELSSEIKLLRALATNGLITTSMIHDLKTINALLVARVDGIKWAIEKNNVNLINRNLSDLKTNDEFLKSWITVITTQTNKDRRKRLKKDIYSVILEAKNLLTPILNRKKIDVDIRTDGGNAVRKIFQSDFDSIIYNLIINSIESFENSKCQIRKIDISLENNDGFKMHYLDSGDGLSEAFINNPYEIFNFGSTSKVDSDGKQFGTGLGMYIIASSINEYNGRYNITKTVDGFGLDISIPL